MKEILFLIFRKIVNLGPRIGLRKIPGVAQLYRFLCYRLGPQGLLLGEVQGHKMWADPRDSVVGQEIIMGGYTRNTKRSVLNQ
jgi:hypothetical protein